MNRQIREITLPMTADSGSEWTVITEKVQKALNLPEPRTKVVTAVGGKKILCRVVDNLEVSVPEGIITTQALVVPEQEVCLLGVTALELMGLGIDPVNQKLCYVYGEGIVGGISA
jgi:predicted aspartyl protease